MTDNNARRTGASDHSDQHLAEIQTSTGTDCGTVSSDVHAALASFELLTAGPFSLAVALAALCSHKSNVRAWSSVAMSARASQAGFEGCGDRRAGFLFRTRQGTNRPRLQAPGTFADAESGFLLKRRATRPARRGVELLYGRLVRAGAELCINCIASEF
jgi:hypothetical protein